jgi:hypothetical protein
MVRADYLQRIGSLAKPHTDDSTVKSKSGWVIEVCSMRRMAGFGLAVWLIAVGSFASDGKMKPKLPKPIDPVAVVSISLEKVDAARARTFYVDALLREKFVVREHTQELAHMLPPGTIKIVSRADGIDVFVDNLNPSSVLSASVYSTDSAGRATANDNSGRVSQLATMLYNEAKKQFGDAVSIRWRNLHDNSM